MTRAELTDAVAKLERETGLDTDEAVWLAVQFTRLALASPTRSLNEIRAALKAAAAKRRLGG